MEDEKIGVLLIEDDPIDVQLIRAAFIGVSDTSFHLERVERFSDALERLGKGSVDVVLLDQTLPDAQAPGMIEQIVKVAPKAMVLVLGVSRDEAYASRQAVLHGAHDYLTKSHFGAYGLSRIFSYLRREKVAREAQRIAEMRFHAISVASPLGICVTDAEGICIYTNAAYQRISGLSQEQILGQPWSSVLHPKDRQRALDAWNQAVLGKIPFQIEFRIRRKDRHVVWVCSNTVAMLDGKDTYGYVQTLEDITERKIREYVLRATEDALFDEMELVETTLNSIADAVLTTDINGKITYLNQAAERLTGWSRNEVLGMSSNDVLRIVDNSTRKIADNPLIRAIHEDRTVRLGDGCMLISRQGTEFSVMDSSSPIHNTDGRITGAVIVLQDITETQALSEKMMHLTQHDFLTGLPNRLLLTDRLAQALEISRRHGTQVALLCMDIDYFKHINDSLGHLIGDQLLQSVASRLTECVRGMDTVCRQGGDEFVILLPEIEHPEDAIHIAEKLLAAIAIPHVIEAHILHVSLSLGISIYPDDGADDPAVMIQNADAAMYHAKANGRNNFQFFKAEMNAQAVQRMTIERGLRRALKNSEFVLHYQPKINLASGAITGAEALIRWSDPESGVIYPTHFIDIAEESGLIVPIGQWVLREACRQVQTWLDAGLVAVPVAVNISAVEFRNSRFLESLVLILQETGMAPQYLQLELTESVLMNNADVSVVTLKRLRAMGLSLAIDDFGTGYSSLSYLQRFPINTLKIDQSFVQDIATNPDDATIVNAVIAMGRNLHQQVIAEGVETGEQFSLLQAQHCDEGQGFHFSPPLSAEAFGRLLEADV
jgi:diguanylate cyclase (GGDEF)-like protein/PAS domain S-box-containing protein